MSYPSPRKDAIIYLMFDGIDVSQYKSNLDLARYNIWWFTPYLKVGALRYFPERLRLALPWMTGVIIYILCFFIAWASGFAKLYVTSIPIYLGVFGISYLTFVVSRLPGKYLLAAFRLKPLLNVTDEDFDAQFNWWLERMCNNKQNFIYSLCFVLVGIFFVDYAWVQADIFQQQNIPFEFVRFMPMDWYSPPLIGKLAIIDIFGLFVLSGVIVSVRGLVLFFIGVSRGIGRLKIRTPYLVRLTYPRFRALDAIHLEGAAHYLVGPFLISIGSLSGGFSPISIILVSSLGVLGACIYMIPHYVTMQNLGKSIAELHEGFEFAYADEVSKLQNNIESPDERMERLSRVSVLTVLLEDIAHLQTWKSELSTWLRGLLILIAPIAFQFLISFADPPP